MAQHLHKLLDDQRQALEGRVQAENCIISNTVENPGDDVYVTLPDSEAPSERVLVAFWRMGVDLDVGGDLVPRLPVRGHRGVALYTDTGEICLIF